MEEEVEAEEDPEDPEDPVPSISYWAEASWIVSSVLPSIPQYATVGVAAVACAVPVVVSGLVVDSVVILVRVSVTVCSHPFAAVFMESAIC